MMPKLLADLQVTQPPPGERNLRDWAPACWFRRDPNRRVWVADSGWWRWPARAHAYVAWAGPPQERVRCLVWHAKLLSWSIN